MTMTPSTPPSRFRKWAGRLALANLVIVIGVVVWFYTAADQHWLATLLLFGPRWVALAPLALLLPLSLLARSVSGVVCCLIAAVLIAGPFMGGTVNIASDLAPPREPGTLRLMTFNADSKSANRELFHRFVETYEPDVICLQDADRILVDDFPIEYRLNFLPGSNGLAMASRYPLKLLGTLSDAKIGPARGAARYRVSFPSGDREVATVHLPTPRPGLEAVLSRKPGAVGTLETVIAKRSTASAIVRRWIDTTPLLAGDFNLPVESSIYRRDWGQYQNAYSEAGLGWGSTMFSNRASVRIDQILFQAPLQCRSVLIGPDLGSAHHPLLADFTQP